MIERNCSESASGRYDLVVVGGGVYGAALALESARRGLKPLLVERDDFGQHTSWNSLRIVHGGLRYLQNLDVGRFFASVSERKWFLQSFPDLVRPLPCLMPLYGSGLRRPAALRLALLVNDVLSSNRNKGIRPERLLPNGRVLSAAETISHFPQVNRRGLRGGALWSDAVVPDSQRLILEMLRWAASCGAVLLNYVEFENVVVDGSKVQGILARDRQTGETYEYSAPTVVNCAGPWSRHVAMRCDRDVPGLFHPSMAFNLFLRCKPTFRVAVAVSPPRAPGITYFLHPWKGGILAGTCHAAGRDDSDNGPDESLVRDFLGDLQESIPGFDVGLEDVLRVHWGSLPVVGPRQRRLATREVIYDHGANGGPSGLFSVSGVKFTLARLVAERTLRATRLDRGTRLKDEAMTPPPPFVPPDAEEIRMLLAERPEEAKAVVQGMVRDEAVMCLEDLLLRRTDWGVHPDQGRSLAEELGHLLGTNLFRRPQAMSDCRRSP